jgi:hypothetical protein
MTQAQGAQLYQNKRGSAVWPFSCCCAAEGLPKATEQLVLHTATLHMSGFTWTLTLDVNSLCSNSDTG